MKSTEVDESLSTITTAVLFQRKSTCIKNQSTEWEIYIKEIYFRSSDILQKDWAFDKFLQETN